jgi:hypothetical protein
MATARGDHTPLNLRIVSLSGPDRKGFATDLAGAYGSTKGGTEILPPLWRRRSRWCRGSATQNRDYSTTEQGL